MQKTHIKGIDLVKVLSMFGILFLHTVSGFTRRPDLIHTTLWWILEPLNALSAFAIPLFFVTSGYLTVTKPTTIRDNFQKTITRLGIPFLFFAFARGVCLYIFRFSEIYSFPKVILDNMVNVMDSQLWFLGVILVFRLLNPVWSLLFKNEHKSIARYTVVMLFTALIGLLIGQIAYGLPTNQVSLFGWVQALFFYLIGGLLRMDWMKEISNWFKIVLFSIVVVIMIGVDYLELHLGVTNNALFVLISLLKLITVPMVFTLLTTISTPSFFDKPLAWLAKMCFGVYVLQEIMVMFRMDALGFEYDAAGLNPYLYASFNYVLIFSLCLLVTWILSKFPKVKILVGAT